ncbi:MAG: ATP-binding protein, partial [Planctomycetota bacterium]
EIGYVVLLRDITKVKNMETQLALKQEMEVLGEMSAIIAHEFRNALNPIKGNARLLSKKISDPEIQEIISDIQQAIEQLNELMVHLLNYAKNQPLELKEVDLRAILQQTSINVSKTLIEKKLFISFRYHGELFITQGDAVTLQQAFGNLILNAIDAVSPETGQISVELSVHDPYYQILFSDNGSGVPPELREKIFRPFFTTKAQGTGLGLAFTHKIIIAHGGTITMNCPESGGTQFLIQFPILPLLSS